MVPLLIQLAACASAPAPARPNSHACNPTHNSSSLPFCNHSLPLPQRVADLISRLSTDEKAHLIAIRGDSVDGGVPRLVGFG